MNISYGHQVKYDDDVYVALANKALGGLAKAGIFGTYLVDFIPLREPVVKCALAASLTSKQ